MPWKRNFLCTIRLNTTLVVETVRAICKKYYVNPVIISLYESKGIVKYFKQLDSIEKDDNKSDLTAEEKMIMKILESN